jgi:cyanophycin synthetase
MPRREPDDLMIAPIALPPSSVVVERPASFAAWRAGIAAAGALPVVAIAGSRGKSTTLDLFDAMLTAHGLRTATWTDQGVAVAGRRQRGELVPWTRALASLASGGLDIAIQELDWDTVHAVGLPRGAYPLVAVTNLCANSDACLLRPDTLRAVRALRTIRDAAHPDAVFVLNGDDWAVAGGEAEHVPRQVLVALSAETPLLRSHRRAGGVAAWIEDGALRIGVGEGRSLTPVAAIAATGGGTIPFQVTNVLIATALALAVGIPPETVASVLRSHAADPVQLPGSFNLFSRDGAAVVVDRPAPPYFLRAPLRAVGHLPGLRQLRVVGSLPGVADEDLVEAGRLLARGAALLILHGADAQPERTGLLRQGVAAHDVPPVVVHAATEAAALNAALRVLRADDVLYVVAEDPKAVVRRLRRPSRMPSTAGR